VITDPGSSIQAPAPAEVFGVVGILLSTSLDASGGNLVIARDAGGWASTTVVSETYAHAGVHDPAFDAALRRVWGQQR
jgi:hypothetical protein